jgi:chromosome partitioning protein
MFQTFNKTKLTNKDLQFLTGCSQSASYDWTKRNVITPKHLNSSTNSKTKYVYDFSDLYNIRHTSLKDTLNFKKKIVVTFNIKGGCTKSTTTVQLAMKYSLNGYKVLLIDADHSNDATALLGINPYETDKSFYHVVIENTPIKESIVEICETLHIIPSNESLDRFNYDFMNIPVTRDVIIKQKLEEIIDDYDLIFIDTHNDRSLVNTALLCAADAIIIPTTCEMLSYRGLSRAFNYFNESDELREKKIKEITRIIPNRYAGHQSIDESYLPLIQKDFGELCTTRIRESTLYKKASNLFLSVFNLTKKVNKVPTFEEFEEIMEQELIGLNTKSTPAQDIQEVGEEILKFLRS